MNFTSFGKAGGVEGICVVKYCEKKTSARGGAYLDLTLADSSGEISAKLWDYKEELQGTYAVNDLVKIRGTISQYNGEDQLRIDRIRKVTEADNVRIEDFVPGVEYSGEYMLAEIEKIVEAFTDNHLRDLVQAVLAEYKEKLLYWPAAFKLHHAVRGGLLYHTLSILRLAQGICKVYPSVDSDLLFTGVILHDLAKIDEFEVGDAGLASGYSVEGNLIGHVVKGVMTIDRIAKEIGTPEHLVMLVEHMVISHHGDPEFGAVVRPMFIEAELLSQLDLMDARVYEMAQAISTTPAGDFSARQWALENRRLYNHSRRIIEPRANLD